MQSTGQPCWMRLAPTPVHCCLLQIFQLHYMRFLYTLFGKNEPKYILDAGATHKLTELSCVVRRRHAAMLPLLLPLTGRHVLVPYVLCRCQRWLFYRPLQAAVAQCCHCVLGA